MSFGIEAPPRALQPVEGDFPRFHLREFDMSGKLIGRIFERALPQGAQDGRVLLVSNSNSRGLGEIQAAHDTNSFRDIPVDTDKLRIVGCSDKAAMKVLIPACHLADIGAPLSLRDQPAGLQRCQCGIQPFRRESRSAA